MLQSKNLNFKKPLTNRHCQRLKSMLLKFEKNVNYNSD